MDIEFTSIDTVSLRLKRPRVWNALLLQLLLGFFIGVVVSFILIYFKDGSIPPKFTAFFSAFLIIMVVIAIIASILMRPKRDLKIEFHPDHISLPLKSRFSRPVNVPYSEINSVVERGNKKRKFIILDTKKRFFVYNLAHFLEPVTSAHFIEILAGYAKAQPDGEKNWQGIKDRVAIFDETKKKKAFAAWGIFAVIVGVFIIEIAMGVINNEMILLELGANSSVLVKDGQWFRLFNCNFLHLDFFHIYFNALFLVIAGILVERLVGTWNFVFIYLFSALGGAVTSTLMSSALFSVGASTAMYGLLGALAFINIKYRGKLPVGYRVPIKNWILLILLTVLFKFLFPQIDDAAHAGGFITGVILTYLIYRNRTGAIISSKPEAVVQVLTIIIAALFLYGGFVSISRYKTGSNPGLVRLAEFYETVPDTSPKVLNSLAWAILTQKQDNREVVGFALKLAEKAVEQKGDEPAFLDTLATAYFLSGNSKAAIETERNALVIKEKIFYASQIANFILNNKVSNQPVRTGIDTNPEINFDSEWVGKGEERHLAIKANLSKEYKRVVAFLKQSRDGIDVCILRFVIDNPREKSFILNTPLKDVQADYKLQVLLIDTSENSIEPAGKIWSYWYYDPKVPKMYKKIFDG